MAPKPNNLIPKPKFGRKSDFTTPEISQKKKSAPGDQKQSVSAPPLKSGKTISTLKVDNDKISRPFIMDKNLYLVKDNAIIKLN